jgi:hypothetical protein
MKNKLLSLICLLILSAFSLPLFAQDASLSLARTMAKDYCKVRKLGTVAKEDPYVIKAGGGNELAWLFALKPQGFMIMAANPHLPPMLAYSTESNFDPADPHGAAVLRLLTSDLSLRLIAWENCSQAYRTDVIARWYEAEVSKFKKEKFDQWPPAGSTTTGGWLETNWTQSSPYNMHVPMDNVAGSRSVAGCPAVAMAQILNYLRATNGTRFNSGDDYHHTYGGNNFWIDNDSTAFDFPGFGTLNFYLDSLDMIYSNKAPMSNNLKAALVFACGTACVQVYNSGGSGTFGIDQAADAFQRFGFADSRLVFDTDTALNTDLANNMKAGLCAHLGLVDSAVTVGHNVVVDGYNTDEFYHFNFGWGGSYNGWFTMPPTSMPYSMTVIEGIVMDIHADSVPSSIQFHQDRPRLDVYPNPVDGVVTIDLGKNYDSIHIEIFDGSGRRMLQEDHINTQQVTLNLAGWAIGPYIITVVAEPDFSTGLKIIKQ